VHLSISSDFLGLKAETSGKSMKATRKPVPDFTMETEEALFWQDHDAIGKINRG